MSIDSGMHREMEIFLLGKAARWVGENENSGFSNLKKKVHEMSAGRK